MAAPTGATQVFRPHRVDDDAPERMRGIYADLVREWRRACDLPTIEHTLRKWAHREPVLRGITSLPGVLDAIDAADQARTDELLLALVRLVQGGEQLAGRTVLQAMLPKLKSMAWRTSGSSSDDWELQDRRQIGVAEFWDVLMHYPLRRRHKVAANLALDTLHRLTAATRLRGVEQLLDPHLEKLEELLTTRADQPGFKDPTAERADVAPVELTTDADLLDVMAWALEVRAISSQSAALLVRVYAPAADEAGGAGPVAEQLGLTPDAVRQRCRRARRSLIEAAHQHANTSLSLSDVCGTPTQAAAVC